MSELIRADRPGGLGRVYRPDPRDRAYAMAPLEAGEDLGSKIWRLGKEFDQGQTSSCVGHAWAHFLHAAPIMARQRDLPTPMEIYREAQKVDEWVGEAYEGTSVRAGAKVLQSLGLISGYVWATNMDSLKKHIVQRGPVVIGADWYAGMGQTRGGYVAPEGAYWGGHAVLVHGWSDSRKAFRCLNSWGEDWGESGTFWMEERDMRYLIFLANGEACSAVEVE